MKKVYLAGQADEYENDWKKRFKKIDGFDFFDWECDSDQSSPDTFFPDDLRGVHSSDILVANPGVVTSEGTWIEIGYFLATHTDNPGDTCENLIIIWQDGRKPRWSIGFVEKAGKVVSTVEEAMKELEIRK